MRIDSMPMAALLLSLAALAGCVQPDWMKPDWTKPEEKAFADSNKRCSQAATTAAPETGAARRQAYSDCMARPGE